MRCVMNSDGVRLSHPSTEDTALLEQNRMPYGQSSHLKRILISAILYGCAVSLLALNGCTNPIFSQKDYLNKPIAPQQLHEIDTVELKDQSATAPMSVEQGAAEVIAKVLEKPEPAEVVELTLADVRAAALKSNLDLIVEVFSPEISALNVDVEEARFESVFSASARRAITDSPALLGTEGSQSIVNSYSVGVDVPLRTGGTARLEMPFNDIATNNPFSLLNPAYQSDLRFSISQPLLRNAGVNVNTHAIRVARYQQQASGARTKLEAIRILANADRAFWNLYAARQELDVRHKQYDLSVSQMDQAKRRVNAGDAASIEITRAESGVAASLQNIIIARSNISRRQRDLKRIMQREDLPMNGPTQVFTATDPNPVGLKLDGEELAKSAVENRMEMLELELQLASDASAIDFQRNQKLPLITLDYAYAINGLGSTYGRSFDQLPDHSFEDWSLGLRAEIPIGNEAAKARYHQAILQRLQRLASKEQRKAAIEQEVWDALDVLEQNWQRILAARQESLLAGRTYEAEKRQFEVGLRTSTDVQDALTRLADAQSREIQALADYQISQVDIAFATGTLLGQGKVRWEVKE